MAQSSVIGLLRVLLSANTAEYDSAMKSAANSAKALTKDLRTFGKHATDVGQSLTAAFTVPIVGLGLAVTKLAVDFEDSFAGVRKTVDATDTEFDQMAQAFRQLSKEIPVNVNELNRLGEAAGALGIPKEDIVDFSRVMAELGVTTNLTSDQAADAIARIQNIFGAAGKDTERLASTIVALGNAGASTEKEITEMAQRIAGAGHTVGLTQAQVVSFASTLASVGINAEAGGSAISRIFLKMNDAVAKGGKGLQEFARVAGTTAAKFKQDFEKDAAGATSAFIAGLGRLKASGENINGTIEGLIGKNIILKDTLFRLSGAGQLLNEQLAIGEKAWQDNTALTVEAGKRFETTSSQITLLWNRIKDVGITLGQALLPMIKSAVGALDGLLPIIERVGTAFANIPGPIQALVVGIGVAVAAAGPLIFIFGQLALSASALTAAFGVAGAAGAVGTFGTALAVIANPMTLTIAALGLVSVAVYGLVTAETDLERAVRENADGFKKATATLESSLDVYNRLSRAKSLTKDESQQLDKATRALADASGLSVEAFNREERASKDLTTELGKQLAERKKLFDETVKQARTGAVEAVTALAKAKEELRKLMSGETQKVDVVSVPGKVDQQTRAFTGAERAKEVERLTKAIAELKKKADEASGSYSKLTGNVSTDSLTFGEWGRLGETAGAKVAKGVKAAGDEVEETGKKAKKTKTEIEKLASELEKMRSDLSGASAIGAANRMIEVLKGLPPVQQLTLDAQRRINTVMGEAIDVYRGFGLKAPADIGAVYKATYQLGESLKVTAGLSKDIAGSGYDTWINTWSRGIPIVKGLGTEIHNFGEVVSIAGVKISNGFGASLADGLMKNLQAIPQMLVNAFTGGGDLIGALKGIASMIGSTIGGGIGFAIGGPLGRAIGQALGSLAGELAGWVSRLFGNAGRDAVKDFADTFAGGFDGPGGLHEALLKGGAAGEALWVKLTQGTGRNNPEQAKANIAEVVAFLAKLKDAEDAAGSAAAKTAEAQAKALEEIAAKYAETLSQIDSERKTLIDRIAGEAPEEFMGLQEIADRARLKELDAQKEAIVKKQEAEEEAAKESFETAKVLADRTLHELQNIFDRGVDIPVRYKFPDMPDMPEVDASAVPSFARGSNGWRNFGDGTLAVLHNTEAVVRPGDTLPGLREPAQVPIKAELHVHNDFSNAYVDERSAEKFAAAAFRQVRRGGALYSEFQNLVTTAGTRGRG